jgi:hypothetical protein
MGRKLKTKCYSLVTQHPFDVCVCLLSEKGAHIHFVTPTESSGSPPDGGFDPVASRSYFSQTLGSCESRVFTLKMSKMVY